MQLGYRTLDDMMKEVGRLVRNTHAQAQNRVRDALNRAYEDAYNRSDWPELRRTIEKEASFVSSQANLALPPNVGKIYTLIQHKNNIEVHPLSLEELLHTAQPSQDQTGGPYYYAESGVSAIHTPIATDGQYLKVQTSVTTDGNKPITLWIKQTGSEAGDEVPITIKLSASADISVASTVTVASGWSVSRIHVPRNVNGRIKVLADTTSGDTAGIYTIAVIEDTGSTNKGGEERFSIYRLLRLWPVPNDTSDYSITYKQTLQHLVRPEDRTLIPVANYLVYSAAADLAVEDDKDVASTYMMKAEKALRESLGGATMGKADKARPLAGSSVRQLGTYYSPWR